MSFVVDDGKEATEEPVADSFFDTDANVSSVRGENLFCWCLGKEATIGGINPLSIDSSRAFFIRRTLWQIVWSLASSSENPVIFITSGHFKAGTSTQRLAAFSYLGSVLVDEVGITGMLGILLNSVAGVFEKG